MTNYKIEVNAIQTMYPAENEDAALQAYAVDAGYDSIATLQDYRPDPITVTPELDYGRFIAVAEQYVAYPDNMTRDDFNNALSNYIENFGVPATNAHELTAWIIENEGAVS